MMNISFQLCVCQGIKYLVSPYESDAQIAFLVKYGYADFVITEDSDLLAYGCEKVSYFNSVKYAINKFCVSFYHSY